MKKDILARNLKILEKCSFCPGVWYIAIFDAYFGEVPSVLCGKSGFIVGACCEDEYHSCINSFGLEEFLIKELYCTFNKYHIENVLTRLDRSDILKDVHRYGLIYSEELNKKELEEIQQSITEDIMSKYKLI